MSFFTIYFFSLFKAGIRVASLFNGKAKKWMQGRKNIFKRLESTIPENEKIIWIHCASLGEFEQGRPIIERLRNQYTGHKILLTFFSLPDTMSKKIIRAPIGFFIYRLMAREMQNAFWK